MPATWLPYRSSHSQNQILSELQVLPCPKFKCLSPKPCVPSTSTGRYYKDSTANHAGCVLFLVSHVFNRLALCPPPRQFYIGVSLAVNNATRPDRRGEMNGIYMTTTSISRAVSPVFASTLFAWSIDGGLPFPFDYHLAFYFLALIRLTVACLGWNRICDNGAVGRNRVIFGE